MFLPQPLVIFRELASFLVFEGYALTYVAEILHI